MFTCNIYDNDNNYYNFCSKIACFLEVISRYIFFRHVFIAPHIVFKDIFFFLYLFQYCVFLWPELDFLGKVVATKQSLQIQEMSEGNV